MRMETPRGKMDYGPKVQHATDPHPIAETNGKSTTRLRLCSST